MLKIYLEKFNPNTKQYYWVPYISNQRIEYEKELDNNTKSYLNSLQPLVIYGIRDIHYLTRKYTDAFQDMKETQFYKYIKIKARDIYDVEIWLSTRSFKRPTQNFINMTFMDYKQFKNNIAVDRYGVNFYHNKLILAYKSAFIRFPFKETFKHFVNIYNWTMHQIFHAPDRSTFIDRYGWDLTNKYCFVHGFEGHLGTMFNLTHISNKELRIWYQITYLYLTVHHMEPKFIPKMFNVYILFDEKSYYSKEIIKKFYSNVVWNVRDLLQYSPHIIKLLSIRSKNVWNCVNSLIYRVKRYEKGNWEFDYKKFNDELINNPIFDNNYLRRLNMMLLKIIIITQDLDPARYDKDYNKYYYRSDLLPTLIPAVMTKWWDENRKVISKIKEKNHRNSWVYKLKAIQKKTMENFHVVILSEFFKYPVKVFLLSGPKHKSYIPFRQMPYMSTFEGFPYHYEDKDRLTWKLEFITRKYWDTKIKPYIKTQEEDIESNVNRPNFFTTDYFDHKDQNVVIFIPEGYYPLRYYKGHLFTSNASIKEEVEDYFKSDYYKSLFIDMVNIQKKSNSPILDYMSDERRYFKNELESQDEDWYEKTNTETRTWGEANVHHWKKNKLLKFETDSWNRIKHTKPWRMQESGYNLPITQIHLYKTWESQFNYWFISKMMELYHIMYWKQKLTKINMHTNIYIVPAKDKDTNITAFADWIWFYPLKYNPNLPKWTDVKDYYNDNYEIEPEEKIEDTINTSLVYHDILFPLSDLDRRIIKGMAIHKHEKRRYMWIRTATYFRLRYEHLINLRKKTLSHSNRNAFWRGLDRFEKFVKHDRERSSIPPVDWIEDSPDSKNKELRVSRKLIWIEKEGRWKWTHKILKPLSKIMREIKPDDLGLGWWTIYFTKYKRKSRIIRLKNLWKLLKTRNNKLPTPPYGDTNERTRAFVERTEREVELEQYDELVKYVEEHHVWDREDINDIPNIHMENPNYDDDDEDEDDWD